jgi:hypothetical protein
MTQEPGESPGLIELAATWFYDTENLDMTVSAGLNLSTSDTSGNLSLFNMDDSGFTFSVSEDQVVPAELDLTPSSSYSSTDREPLIYRDFMSENNTGQSYLYDYSWSNAETDSTEEGPSFAAAQTDDPFSSRVMVMTYDLGVGQWSAGDFLPIESEVIDLSGYSELSFYLYRQNLGDDNLELELSIGENGESSDLDESGTIDEGNSSYVITKDLTSQIPSTAQTWEKISIPLTESEMKKLTRVRSFRFILSSSGGESQGELLAGGFSGEGSPLQMSILTSAGIERDAEDLNVQEVTDSELSSSFTEVSSIFHPDDEDQKVLKISWGEESPGGDALDEDDTIKGTGWFSQIPVADYGEFNLYIKNESTQGEGTISLTDSSNQGIVVNYEPGSTEWEKLTVDLRSGSASFSGDSTVKSLEIDKDTSYFSKFKITRTGLASGVMMVDEIHFSDPSFSTSTSIETSLDYTIPGIIAATASGFPILSDFNVSTRLNYYTQTTESYFNQDTNRLESQLSSGVDLMNIRLQGDLSVIRTDENILYSGGHLVRIPSHSTYGWISDSYSRSFYESDNYMTRSNVFHLTPFKFITMEADTSASASDSEITQGWGGFMNFNIASMSMINISMDLYQSSDWESDSTDYLNDWSRDFSYLIPTDEGIDSREGTGSVKGSRTSLPVGVIWESQVGYEALQQLVWQQENQWYSDLSFPISINTMTIPWTITPGYRRDLVQKVYPENNSSFTDDINTLFTTLGSQFPLYHFIPFYEIFGKESLDDFEKTLTMTDDSVYTPEAYINFSRQSGSDLSDFFIPSGVDIEVNKEFYKNVDSLYTENQWSFQVLQSANNVLGEWGSHPFFNFYNTDEWSSSLQLTLGGTDLWIPEPQELIYQNYVTLLGESDWEIVLDNQYTHSWDDLYSQDDFQLIFCWYEPEIPYFLVPFFNQLIMKPSRMQHEEKLIFTGYFDRDDSDNTYYDTVLKHESKLVITGLGYLKGWMALGLGGKDEVFSNGYELGLELQMNF